MNGIKLHNLYGVAGSAITADAAGPNTTQPPERRIVGTPQKGSAFFGGPCQIAIYAKGGTTCNVELWIFVPELARWFLHSAAAAVAVDVMVVLSNVPSDAQVFLRVSANTGVEQLGYHCF